MKIQWLGHSCFLITNADGRTLLTDPFDGSLGYPVPRSKADIVTVSHGHFDHNYVAELPAGYLLVTKPTMFAKYGFAVYGVNCYHDDAEGEKRGRNIIYVIEADGVRVAHLGDLGHLPSPKQLTQLGRIDVLLTPVGGFYTIAPDQAVEVVKLIKPRVTVPMHYRNQYWKDTKIQPVDAFLALAGGAAEGYEALELVKDSMDRVPRVIVMKFVG